ncbi:hypothetical protein JCM30204_35080 [Dysgonomonas termitidis]
MVQAQSKIESNPAAALLLLDSIRSPEEMDRGNYMQYIVADIQARYKTYQDIRKDTLIFEAQKYFDKEDNPYQAALANYYTASVYHENKITEKELEYFMLAEHYARIANDSLLLSKSQHSIGNFYYEKNVYDSAIVNFRKTLNYYPKNRSTESSRLNVIKTIGLSFYSTGKMDSAYYYFEKGLQMSDQFHNHDFHVIFIHMLGITLREQREYVKAGEYLRTAFSETSNPEEAQRIHIGLMKLYNTANRLDSAKHYASLFKEDVWKNAYVYSRRDMYNSLAEFYQKSGDYKNALHYSNLHKEALQEINEANNFDRIAEADRRHKATLHQKEVDRLNMRNYLYLLIGVSVILIILVVTYFNNRTMRLKRQRIDERNKLLEDQSQVQQKLLEHQDESLTYMQGIYRNIVTEWVEIDKQVKSLAKEFGAKEEPELYVKIKKMVESFRQNTNEQLVGQAKEHFQKLPYGESVLSSLKDKELLLFMLYYCGYKRNDVAILLGVRPHKENMNFRKLDLRNKLLKAGMPKDDIGQILFAEDNED